MPMYRYERYVDLEGMGTLGAMSMMHGYFASFEKCVYMYIYSIYDMYVHVPVYLPILSYMCMSKR